MTGPEHRLSRVIAEKDMHAETELGRRLQSRGDIRGEEELQDSPDKDPQEAGAQGFWEHKPQDSHVPEATRSLGPGLVLWAVSSLPLFCVNFD